MVQALALKVNDLNFQTSLEPDREVILEFSRFPERDFDLFQNVSNSRVR